MEWNNVSAIKVSGHDNNRLRDGYFNQSCWTYRFEGGRVKSNGERIAKRDVIAGLVKSAIKTLCVV